MMATPMSHDFFRFAVLAEKSGAKLISPVRALNYMTPKTSS